MTTQGLTNSIDLINKKIKDLQDQVDSLTPELINIDIMVIGAGISGLYTCYQSIKKNSTKKILCIDKLSRVGGRLTSVQFLPESGESPPQYYAEGCAARFFLEADPEIVKLLEEMNIGNVPQPNNLIITGKEYIDIYSKVKQKYPEDPSLCELAFPQAISQACNNFEDVDVFCNTSGYQLFKYPINCDMAYKTLDKITTPTQRFVEGGYVNLCNKLEQYINANGKNISIVLNTPIANIKYTGSDYIVNNKWICKKIVYTGTISQLNQINTYSDSIMETKRLLYKYYQNYDGLRMYFKFDKPWWKKEELFYKFNGAGPINSLIYYTDNSVMIYNNMYIAPFLYNFLPFEIKNNNDQTIKWYPSVMAEDLKKYIIKYIKEYVEKGATKSPELNISVPTQEQVESLSFVAYRINQEAAEFLKPMKQIEYDGFFKRLSNTDNFHLISGDFSPNPGWVNSCLVTVNNNIDNILS